MTKRREGRANLGHEGKGRLETIQKIVAAVAYLRWYSPFEVSPNGSQRLQKFLRKNKQVKWPEEAEPAAAAKRWRAY